MVSEYSKSLLKRTVNNIDILKNKKGKLIKMIDGIPGVISFNTLKQKLEENLGYSINLNGNGNEIYGKFNACGKQPYCNEMCGLNRCNTNECPIYL
ncbi:hypothetical protein J4465_01495 [Candidatus Pacearchaeota archaeon]|nr:hypothetical protein [Candidatus Pacearchaeota archaeon]